jgi:hypothetical protein
MRRRIGRGRRGPGLLGTIARTAVVAGTASAVAGRVSAGQQAAGQREQQALDAQARLQEIERQAQVDAQVAAALARQHAAAPPPVAPPTPSSPSAGPGDVITQLTRLGELRDAGILTDEEFAVQKARVLAP